MEFATVDMICRRILIERGLPIHYYVEAMAHCCAAVRELTKDTLKSIKAANIPVNEYNSGNIPSDFTDDIAVCIPVNGLLQPLPKNDNINPIIQHDATTGAFVPYPSLDSSEETFFGFPAGYGWYWNVNEYGESTGGYFGSKGGTTAGYKVIKERRQIQFTGTVQGNSFILLYISNGQHPDDITQVDWRSFSSIQSYYDWKASPNYSIKDSPEAMTYYNERRKLVASLDDITKADILNILRSSYTAAPKN